jgi:predicted acylesterase/phospholipase RssA
MRHLLGAATWIGTVCLVASIILLTPKLSGAPSAGADLMLRGKTKPAPEKQDTAQPTKPATPPERKPFSADDQAAAIVLGIPDARVFGDSQEDFGRLLPTVPGPWLALSGGGSDGAFGAGLLAGLTQAGKRPEFAVVSGVSIGGLIAPYVFLGSKYDGELEKLIVETTAADVFEDRVTAESLFDSWPLKRAIERRATPQMLAAIASEHQRGRRLWVTTTNLDSGRSVVWNMGAIAARGGDEALKLFRGILLASSSIPGFFAPVAIGFEVNRQTFLEMHNDGTLTAPFYVAPETLLAAGRLPAKDIYVVVNGKLVPDFSMPGRSTVEILGRSISVALTYGLRTELTLLVAAARKQGFELKYAHIPSSFNHETHGVFDGKYMKALFDYAAKKGKEGIAFEVIAGSTNAHRTSAQ